MRTLRIKTIRFILNIILYATILICATYYTYTFQPGLYALKNFIVPMNGVIFLTIILSIILAGLNEIITIFVIRFQKR